MSTHILCHILPGWERAGISKNSRTVLDNGAWVGKGGITTHSRATPDQVAVVENAGVSTHIRDRNNGGEGQ